MIDTRKFGEELKKLGYQIYCGVPCSFLKNFINYAINNCEYIAATNEGDAVAIATGAFIGGKKSVVLMQNSGLSNAISPLTSLNYPFRLPLLGFVSLRGEPGIIDEPQHELMGMITEDMLRIMDVTHEYLSYDLEEAKKQLKRANKFIEENKTFFFIVRNKTFSKEILLNQSVKKNINVLTKQKSKKDQEPQRFAALRVINSLKDDKTIQIAPTGKAGRELYEIEDAPNNLYMVGSMGCAGSLGIGLALARKDKDIVVIDGDGALLMRMGSLATNGFYNPENVLHILLDNNSYDSTGGQTTVSNNVDFVSIAASCGYRNSIYIHTLSELDNYMRQWKRNKGLTFLYLKISTDSSDTLGRPKQRPFEIVERLKVFING